MKRFRPDRIGIFDFKSVRGVVAVSLVVVAVATVSLGVLLVRGQACPSGAKCAGHGAQGKGSCGPMLAMASPRDLAAKNGSASLAKPAMKSPDLTPEQIHSFMPKQRLAVVPSAPVKAAAASPAPGSGASPAPIRLAWPLDNTVVTDNVVTLKAEVDPGDMKTTAKVSFYVGDQLIGDACPGKPEVTWTTRDWSPGAYVVTARIYSFESATRSVGPEKARATARVTILSSH